MPDQAQMEAELFRRFAIDGSHIVDPDNIWYRVVRTEDKTRIIQVRPPVQYVAAYEAIHRQQAVGKVTDE